MPARTKFTAERRARILELLAAGASRRTAAQAAGVDHATLSRWIARGETAHPEGRWAEFLRQVREAEAHPKVRALAAVYHAMPDNPDLAFRFLELTEPGFAKTQRAPASPDGMTVVRLTFPPASKLRDPDDDT